jgi:zinc protease
VVPVGSRNETAGHTGISHWVEHMQFKGTPQFPAGVLDKAISREGGFWNAFTYLDWTAYFETMPSDKIHLALRLEADRMVNSLYDPGEVESERTVVISEREGDENEPLFRLGEAVQSAAFETHPYRHEIIGYKKDLRRISRDQLYGHYRKYYHPANAILAIAGDFDSGEMLALVEEIYGPIASARRRKARLAAESDPQGEKRIRLDGPGETTYLQLAYRAPAASDPDFFPLTVVDSLLTGPSSLNMFGRAAGNNRPVSLLHLPHHPPQFELGKMPGGAGR